MAATVVSVAMQPPPYDLNLEVSPVVNTGTATFTITGGAPGSAMELAIGRPGLHCPPELGGECFDLGENPLLQFSIGTADATGTVVFEVGVVRPIGSEATFQAYSGSGSDWAFSQPETRVVLEPVPGCTDPNSPNYDPAANLDDGSCIPNPCGTVFVDRTAESGLPTDANGGGVVWVDVEGDGDQDLFVVGVGLFVNDGTGVFTDETAARIPGSVGTGLVFGAAAADFDSDGDVDLFVPNDTRSGTVDNLLYVNDGTGHFTDMASTWGVQLASTTPGASVFVDYDRDNDIDLLHATEFGSAKMFRNDGAPPFVDDSGAFDVNLQGDSAAWADIDDDGGPELFIATGSGGSPNRLFDDGGTGSWLDVGGDAGLADGVGSRWGGATWVDINDDGLLDLHQVVNVTNDYVYLNNGDGTFQEQFAVDFGIGNGSDVGVAAVWQDYDLDGDLDAFLADGGLFRNEGGGGGEFTNVTEESGLGIGFNAAWGDANGDGRPDLYLGSYAVFTDKLYIAEDDREGCTPPSSIQVRAVIAPNGADRDAIGARIDVDLEGDGDFARTGGSRVVTQIVGSAQSGDATLSALTQTIGVGDADEVNVRVTFVDGTVRTANRVRPGEFVLVRDNTP